MTATVSMIASLIVSVGLMLTGAVTICGKLLEVGEKSAQKVSKSETESKDN